MNIGDIEKNFNYRFKDKSLLKRALTLASADGVRNNQTMEFFGDAVLEFIVTERLFDINSDEGSLTKKRANIVRDDALACASKRLGLENFLIKSSGDNNNKKAVPSAYEAVIAAIYIDGGLNAAKQFVYSTLDFNYEETNYIGELQELLQEKKQTCPEYSAEDAGTPQAPCFKAKVNVFGKAFTGVGESKQQAKQNAAKSALEYLNNLK